MEDDDWKFNKMRQKRKISKIFCQIFQVTDLQIPHPRKTDLPAQTNQWGCQKVKLVPTSANAIKNKAKNDSINKFALEYCGW